MKISDVPQDIGISEDIQVVSYATEDDGRYVKVGSRGWDPINVANGLAWQQITETIAETVAAIDQGHQSSLAFHMVLNQMDVPLLAHYTGFYKWRVRRHLKPKIFAKLKPELKEKYAVLFKISIAELEQVPDFPLGGL